MIGTREFRPSMPGRWIEACERHLCRQLANAPGRPWRAGTNSGHLFGAGAAIAPPTVLVVDDIQWVAEMLGRRG